MWFCSEEGKNENTSPFPMNVSYSVKIQEHMLHYEKRGHKSYAYEETGQSNPPKQPK